MKKFLMFITTLLLVFALFPLSNTSARVESSEGDPNRDYFSYDEAGVVLDHEFNGSGTWGDKNGIYSPNTREEDGKLVYTGTNGQFITIKPDALYKNTTVTIDIVVELVGVTDFYTCARESYANYEYPSILRESGVTGIQYDEDGKITAINRRNGWLNGTDDWSQDVLEITEEGYLHMQFNIVTGSAGIAEIGITAEGSGTFTVKMESFKSSVPADPIYLTYLWNTSIEDLDLEAAPWDVQPVWGNNPIEWETEYPLEGTHSIKLSGSAGTGQTQIGGLDNTNEGKKLLKDPGLYYIQMDVDSPDFQWFNIWTSGNDYYDVKYDMDNGWSAVGKVQNFKAVQMDTCWRISYFVEYTDANTPHNINVCNGSGSIYFDNIIVAYEDNTPYVQANATYDIYGTKDVEVAVDGKGSVVTNVFDAGGYDLDASKYTILEDKVIFSKDLFNDTNEYFFNIKVGNFPSQIVAIKPNDNRPVVEVSVSGVSKVYDGNTDVNMDGVTFTLTGVTAGHDVSFAADLEYSSENAGDSITLLVTNATLTGADANKYKLPTSITLTGSITKKVVAVVADAKEKTAGEDDPELTYTASGLLGNDKLSGELSRKAGEEVGTYDIELGTLTASDNYEIKFTSAQLTIKTVEKSSKGCGGSVVASIFATLSLAGCALVLRKKREE